MISCRASIYQANNFMIYDFHDLAGCTKLLRGTAGDSITFNNINAYMIYNTWKTKNDAVFECMLRTHASTGIIMYNEGWKK